MRKIGLVCLGLVVAGLVAFALLRRPPQPGGLKSASTQTQEPELVSVPRTKLADAKQEFDKGSVVMLDVRDADSYIASHIPGALQIPLARVEGEVNYLRKTKPIIAYCT
jgi:hypothetical protein